MKYTVEPVEINRPRSWGDVNPATKELTGNYNGKTKGACKPAESTVVESNGYDKVTVLAEGISPLKAIFDR